jgi:hypothetical protein
MKYSSTKKHRTVVLIRPCKDPIEQEKTHPPRQYRACMLAIRVEM